MNSIQQLTQKIQSSNTRLVYISGKTSTGKSTLSRALHDALDFAAIDLDQIIVDIPADEGVNKFIEVYVKRDDMVMINEFVERTRSTINTKLSKHAGVVFEGAIATTETLLEVVQEHGGEFLFVYLLPVHFDLYCSRITQRFGLENPGLPDPLWQEVSRAAHTQYLKDAIMTDDITQGIARFTKNSMDVARTRLEMFQQTFKDIYVIEV